MNSTLAAPRTPRSTRFAAARRRPRTVLGAIAVLVAVAAIAAGCSDGVHDRATATASHQQVLKTASASTDVGLLFSVLAPTMVVATDGANFTLTIPATSTTAWFTDRPERNAGSFTAADLVSIWSAEQFDTDPPNAAVAVTVNGEQHQHVVELSDPKVSGSNISFHAVDIGDDADTDPVAGRDATHDLIAGSFKDAELFIDNGVGPPCPSSITSAGFSPCLIPANGKVTFKATISANSQQYAQITKPEPTDPNSTGAFTVAATANSSQNRTPWGPCANPCILQYFSGQTWTISAGSQAVNFTVDWLSQGGDEGDGYGNFDDD